MNAISTLGRATVRNVCGFGDFCVFTGQMLASMVRGVGRWRNWKLAVPQMYEAGTRSIPVVVITGAFVGMVLAVQTVTQFRAIGLEAGMGAIVNKSVLMELGPVIAALALAGRVGGGLTAELGTMRVTEQIDALRAMGSNPIRVLVVPRVIACVLLIPILTVYSDLTGILGGYAVSTYVYNVEPAEFWRLARTTVGYWEIFYGLSKSFFFGGAIGIICCYKGFRCAPGAAGVGRACTGAFVASCMAILALNLFIGMFLNAIYESIWGTTPWL